MFYALDTKQMTVLSTFTTLKKAELFAQGAVQRGVHCYIMDSPSNLRPFSRHELVRLYYQVTGKQVGSSVDREGVVTQVMTALDEYQPHLPIDLEINDMPRVKKIDQVTDDQTDTELQPGEAVIEAPGDETEAPAKRPRQPGLRLAATARLEVGEVPEDAKLPKQVQGILEAVRQNPGLTKEELLEVLPQFIEARQPVKQVFGFYQRRLVSDGLLRVVETADAPDTEEPEVA